MIAVVLAPFALSLLVGAAAPRIARACAPRWAAMALVVAALLASLATGLVLCAVAVLGVAELPASGRAGHWSVDAIADRAPVPLPVAALAGLLAVALLARAGFQLVRSGRRVVEATRTCRALGPGSGGLIVVPDQRAGAFAVPGFGAGTGYGGRMVLTSALLRTLDPAERSAVLSHEAAHLRHRHFVYVQLAELAAAANPVLRSVAPSVRLAVECWADEEAVDEVGDPHAVARAIAKAALRTAPAGLALAMAETDLACRVRGLLSARPRRARWAVAVVTAALVSAGCATVVAAEAHALVEHAQHEYPRA